MRIYIRDLPKTYYENGFFNVQVHADNHVRESDGPIKLELGDSGRTVDGKVKRIKVNQNGTARIFGGAVLRDWFHQHFDEGGTMYVEIVSKTHLRLWTKDPR